MVIDRTCHIVLNLHVNIFINIFMKGFLFPVIIMQEIGMNNIHGLG